MQYSLSFPLANFNKEKLGLKLKNKSHCKRKKTIFAFENSKI